MTQYIWSGAENSCVNNEVIYILLRKNYYYSAIWSFRPILETNSGREIFSTPFVDQFTKYWRLNAANKLFAYTAFRREDKTGGKKYLQCIVKRQDANVSVYTLIILAGGETEDAVISVHIRDGNRWVRRYNLVTA